ncbi:MAG: class I SAM-dependent methyltransferase [Segetibacter sp.]
MTNEAAYLNRILSYIQEKDPLHYKKVRKNIDELTHAYQSEFNGFLLLLVRFFSERNLPAEKVTADYLKMIDDMRIEGMHFKKNKKYSCTNQHNAYVNVYSKPEIMEYYMNALLLSQVLWTHHFKMLMFFSTQLKQEFLSAVKNVLDIGPGHGFFSYLVIENLATINDIDVVDISDGSLEMTKAIIGDGNGKIQYFNRDIFKYESNKTYDLIILGEVLEHLDEPLLILKKLRSMLSNNGYLWLTTPTNAPALDHVYLFRSKQEIVDLLHAADLEVVYEFGCFAEDVSEEMAVRFDISYLYGAFLKNKTA